MPDGCPTPLNLNQLAGVPQADRFDTTPSIEVNRSKPGLFCAPGLGLGRKIG